MSRPDQPQIRREYSNTFARTTLVESIGLVLRQPWRQSRKLGEICKLFRRHKGQSQREVAKAAGCSPARVCRLERGDAAPTGYARLARALGIQPDALLALIERRSGGPTSVEEMINAAIAARAHEPADK